MFHPSSVFGRQLFTLGLSSFSGFNTGDALMILGSQESPDPGEVGSMVVSTNSWFPGAVRTALVPLKHNVHTKVHRTLLAQTWCPHHVFFAAC